MINRVKNAAFILIALCCSVLLNACSDDALNDTQGRRLSLSAYHGKWVFINYWASWCQPCQEEIPVLNAFYQQHKDKDAVVLGVNYDQVDVARVKQLIRQTGIKFPVFSRDPAQLLGLQSVSALPTTYVFNPQGKLERVLLGPQTHSALETILLGSTV